MEHSLNEDIKVLEDFIKYFEAEAISRKYRRNISVTVGEDDIQAIENLVKAYRELEEENNKFRNGEIVTLKSEAKVRKAVFNDFKNDLKNYIPKSKVEEKIEEYQANMKLYEQHLSNIFHENDIRQEVITVLTDLLREENNESKF